MKKIQYLLTLLPTVVILSGCDGNNSFSCENPQVQTKAIHNLNAYDWQRLSPTQKAYFKDYDDYVSQNHIKISFDAEIKQDGPDKNDHRKMCSYTLQAQPVTLPGKSINSKFQAYVENYNDKIDVATTVSNLTSIRDLEDIPPTHEQTAYDQAIYGEARAKAEKEKEAIDAKKNQIKSIPLSEYKFLSADQLLLAYIANNPQLSDDQIMSLYSPEYANTSDQFVKNDLIKNNLPAIKEKASTYRGVKYIKYIISGLARRPSNIPNDSVYVVDYSYTKDYDSTFYQPKDYDFTKNLFSVKTGMGCEENSHTSYSGFNLTQGTSIVVPKENALLSCSIKPKDETQAREWSSVFSATQKNIYEVMYLAIDNWTPAPKQNQYQQTIVNSYLTAVEFNYFADYSATKPLISGIIR